MSSMTVANRQAAGPCPRAPWWGRHVDLVVLLAAPWILLLAGSSWFYSDGHSDAWLYHGAFFELPRYLKEIIPDSYYITRLPWLVPGYLAYQVFPPQAAHVVLHLLFYYSAAFSLYYVVRQTVNRKTALLGSLLFCTHFDFLLVIGTDYVIGPAITYLLLSLALVTLSKYSAWQRTGDVCAGGALVSAVLVYPALVVFVPLVGLYALIKQPQQRRSSSWRELLAQSCFLTLGGALTTVGFGLINVALGGRFAFFMPSVRYILRHYDVGKQYHLEWEAFIFSAHWLVFPAAALASAAGVVALAIARRGKVKRTEFVLAAMSLCTCVYFLVMDIRGDCYLSYGCFTAMLMPFIFPALCAFALKVPERMHALWVVVLVLIVTGSALPQIAEGLQWSNPITDGYPRLIVVVALVAGGLVLKAVWGRSQLGTVLSWVVLLAAYMGSCTAFPAYNHVAADTGPQLTERVDSVLAFLHTHVPEGRPFFWYNRNEVLAGEYIAVSGTFGWGGDLINDELPGVKHLNKPSPVEFAEGQYILVLTMDGALFTAAEEAVQPLGCRFTFVDETEVAAGRIHYLTRLYRTSLIIPGEPIGLCTDGTAGAAVLGGNSTPGPLTAELWKPEETCRFDRLADTIAVESTREPSGYVASYGPIEIAEAGEYVFVVKYRLQAGSLLLGCLNEGRGSWLALATTDDRTTGSSLQRVRLSLSAGQQITLMLTANKPATRFSITGAYANKLKPPT